MTIVVLIVVTLAVAGAGVGVAYPRVQEHRAASRQQRQARQTDEESQQKANLQAERDLQRDRWRGYLERERTRHQAALTPLEQALRIAREQVKRRQAILNALPEPQWTRLQLALRLFAMVFVTALFVLGLFLTAHIFVALNNGWSLFAVAKGVGAAFLELLLAIVMTHLLTHREPRSTAWQCRVWGAMAVLVITLAFIYQYAPARSSYAMQDVLVLDQQEVDIARNPTGRPADPIAVHAAERRQQDDLARLAQAQAGDRAQALLFPLGQVLAGELALEGGLALVTLRLRRGRKRDVEAAEEDVEMLNTQHLQAQRAATEGVVTQLVAAGHDNPLELISRLPPPTAGRTTPPSELPPSPGSPPDMSTPPAARPIHTFDPSALHGDDWNLGR